MAQAIDLELVSRSLTALGEQVPLLAHHPVLDAADRLDRLLRAVERTQLTLEEHGVLLRNLTGTLERVEVKLQVLERASFARTQNSTSLRAENVIYPLLLPDGQEPVDFPGTVAELRAMTDAQIRQWLANYNLVAPAGSKAARLKVLMEHLGLPGAA
ncbi:hypothetical protein FRC06_001258 [Ceratobasidium sp. 370]|nr:hypothetical protein FRC06_001258 [Ceratobasidium sp. 370]